MLIRKTAVNYASALFSIPGTKEDIQKRESDLARLVEIIRKHPPVLQMLSYPGLPVEDRVKKVEELLKMTFDPVLKRFLCVFLTRQKVAGLIAVASEYHRLVLNDLKSLEVILQTPGPMTEEVREKLRRDLEKKYNKKINLIETIDPKLLGGFVLLIGNKLLDLSLSGKLAKLKNLILKGEA